MTRHARNNTASAVYSYHERQRDTQSSGYGTQKQRLAKESIKDFDACNLTLQKCRHPVLTKEGFLYDKEAILEYIIHQKAENARKMKEYEKQKKKDEDELKEIALKQQQERSDAFINLEKKFSNDKSASTSGVGSALISNISNMNADNKNKLPSFWVPSMTPESKQTKLKKPDNVVYCPMSGKPLKVKDLIDVKFTPLDGTSDSNQTQYMCAVTRDVLSNSVPCAVIRQSGCVVTMECVEKLIRKEMKDPINGAKLTERDIIPLHRGGTGYASTNKLEAKVKRPVLMA